MANTGTITTHESGEDLVIEWQIQSFSTLQKTDGGYYCSPLFFFGGEEWRLYIYPNGFSYHGTSGHVGLVLFKYSSGRSIGVSLSLSLKTAKGERHREEHVTKEFGVNWFHILNRFVPRTELTTLRCDLLPDDVLTVVCTMRRATSAGSDSHYASAEISTPVSDSAGCSSDSSECRHCKGNFAAGILSSHQKKCMQRPVKCPDCLEIIVLQKWFDEHHCQHERPEGATSTAECPHCKLTLEAARLPTNEKTCIDRPMKCPQCGEDVVTKLWLEHKCLTARTNDYNCREKILMALCIVSIIIAVVTGCVLAHSKTPLSPLHPGREAVTKIDTSELNNTSNGSELDGSGSNKIGDADIMQSGVKKAAELTLIAELDAELNRADQSEIVGSDNPVTSLANQADNDQSEAVTKIETSELNSACNGLKLDGSASNKIGDADIMQSRVNKAAELTLTAELDAELNRVDQSKIVGSDNPVTSVANQADNDESEPLPEPVLVITNVSSTCLEIVWIRPEEPKTNAGHTYFIVHFRKYGEEWKEASSLNASITSYFLSNLDPGMSYQIYVVAADSSGFSRSSGTATVQTSDKVIDHSPSSKGREKQFLLYAATITILIIAIACTYGYSKTSFSALQPCGVTLNNHIEDCGCVTDINHLLKDNKGIDVIFELETASGETKIFAHKLILAVMSSHFADLFYDKGRNKGHQVIPLKGINLKAFEQMIRYCYGENPTFERTEEVCVLFKVASAFKVISLQNLCCSYLRHTKIEPKNVFSILKISVEMEDKNLQDTCYNFLQEKTREVMAAYKLHDVTPAMVYTLLNLPKLSLNSEYELIKWICDWTKLMAEDEDSSFKNAREYLESLLKYMNFLALTMVEFTILCKDNPELFTCDEIITIYQNIACPGIKEMPDWYDKDVKCRVYTGSNE